MGWELASCRGRTRLGPLQQTRDRGGGTVNARRNAIREREKRTERYTTRCSCVESSVFAASHARTTYLSHPRHRQYVRLKHPASAQQENKPSPTYSRSIFSNCAALPACARIVPNVTKTTSHRPAFNSALPRSSKSMTFCSSLVGRPWPWGSVLTRRPYSPTRDHSSLSRSSARSFLPTAPVPPRRSADLPVLVAIAEVRRMVGIIFAVVKRELASLLWLK